MLGSNKLREAIFMIKNRKNFKKVSIGFLQENQKYTQSLRDKLRSLENYNRELKEKCDSLASMAANLVDENRELKKQIDELEGDQKRWDMLDL